LRKNIAGTWTEATEADSFKSLLCLATKEPFSSRLKPTFVDNYLKKNIEIVYYGYKAIEICNKRMICFKKKREKEGTSK